VTRDEEMDEIWNNRQYLYVIPEKIFFNSDLTIDDLRVFGVISSFINSRDSSTNEVYDFLKDKININEENARKSIDHLIVKVCLSEKEGYITLSHLYLWQ
jgi:hypothetical protein